MSKMIVTTENVDDFITGKISEMEIDDMIHSYTPYYEKEGFTYTGPAWVIEGIHYDKFIENQIFGIIPDVSAYSQKTLLLVCSKILAMTPMHSHYFSVSSIFGEIMCDKYKEHNEHLKTQGKKVINDYRVEGEIFEMVDKYKFDYFEELKLFYHSFEIVFDGQFIIGDCDDPEGDFIQIRKKYISTSMGKYSKGPWLKIWGFDRRKYPIIAGDLRFGFGF